MFARSMALFGMTTSLSSAAVKAPITNAGEQVASELTPEFRPQHTLASRFLFLILCTAVVLSALAYGTVHYWALALFQVGAAAVVALWLLDGWQLRFLRISRNSLQLPLLGMLALGAVQLLPLRTSTVDSGFNLAVVQSLSLDAYATRLVLVQVLALLVYFGATLVFTDTPHRLRLLVRTIIVFGFLLAIFGLTQSFTSGNKVYWVRELPQSIAFGPFINRHHFAGYMEMTIALPLGLLFAGAIDRDKRFVYFFAVTLMGVALVMTTSRGGILSLIAEVLFLTAITGGRQSERKRKEQRISGAAMRTALALTLIIVVFAGVVLLGGEGALSRLTGTVNAEDPTTGRAHFWSVTLDIIKDHPLIGTGLGAFSLVYTRYDTRNGFFRLEQVHNDYLQVLADGGIIGAGLALFFVVALFRRAFAVRESRDNFRRGVCIGATAGCFAVLVHSFFDFTLHTTSNALLFLVLAGLATMNGRVERPSRRRASG